VEQRLDRPEAERFVADFLDQALFVGRRKAQVLFLEQRADDAVDLLLKELVLDVLEAGEVETGR